MIKRSGHRRMFGQFGFGKNFQNTAVIERIRGNRENIVFFVFFWVLKVQRGCSGFMEIVATFRQSLGSNGHT